MHLFSHVHPVPCDCIRMLCRKKWHCVLGVEEIEFMQLMFREDFISDSYFGGNLHGIIATEELHFGEGMHRKAFRSRVMQGLVPVFSPGHPCVLKVHNAITYGTKSKDDLVQKNYKLALQVSFSCSLLERIVGKSYLVNIQTDDLLNVLSNIP